LTAAQSNTVAYQPFFDLVYSEIFPPDKDINFSKADKNTFIKVLSNSGSPEEGSKDSDGRTASVAATSETSVTTVPVEQGNSPNIAFQPTSDNLTGTHIYRYAPYKLDTLPQLARTSSPQPAQSSRTSSPQRVQAARTTLPHPVKTSRPFFYGTPLYWIFPELRMDDVHEMYVLVKTAMYDFLDVPLIRSVIDLYYD
ncbi:MAG: hypothetical protein GY696_27995, partial [Gammaproteobacteria bacterium]|nr:hypothetical protein [Gammaproteobacteria bacterium]